MPTYQYTCTDCGEPLEVVQKFTDDALTECPSCTGRLRKVYSAVGVVFKGSGFYRNDSRSTSSSTVSAGNGKAGPDAASSSSSDNNSSGSSSGSGGSTDSSGSTSTPSPAPAATGS